MNLRQKLVLTAKTFAEARGLSISRVSTLVFNDGKTIDAILRRNADITTDRFERAMQWFSDNWPHDASWPAGVSRPLPVKESAK